MKINSKIRHSHRRTCPFKVKLELENAQEYLLLAMKDTKHYRNPEDLNLYLCTACGWLHIGHKLGTKKEQT